MLAVCASAVPGSVLSMCHRNVIVPVIPDSLIPSSFGPALYIRSRFDTSTLYDEAKRIL